MGRPSNSTKSTRLENPLLPPIEIERLAGDPWTPRFRDTYEPLLKLNPELRRLHTDRKCGLAPTDEDWMRALWPSVFPTARLSLTTGHITSFGNGLEQLEQYEDLQRRDAGKLIYRAHRFDVPFLGRTPFTTAVVWNVEAAMLVLDLVRDEFELLLNAALKHHRVPQYWPETRRREKGLPEFSYETFVREGIPHLAEQGDVRVPAPPECAWALPLLVEAMLEMPPTVRRIWVEHGSLAVANADADDGLDADADAHAGAVATVVHEGWGYHFQGDLVEQLKLTIMRRLVDDQFSDHELAKRGAYADLSAIEHEWQTSVVATWHPQLGALVEPVLPLQSMMTLAASTMNKSLARDQNDRAQKVLDDIANWVLVRLVGSTAPGRCWVDPRARTKFETLLRVLLRPHLSAVTAPDWPVAYQSDGRSGSGPARQQQAAIWVDVHSVADALVELAGKRTFREAITAWTPGARTDTPTTRLSRRATELKRRTMNGGTSSREKIRGHENTEANHGSGHGAQDVEGDGEGAVTVAWLLKSLSPNEGEMVKAVLAGSAAPESLPADLLRRIKEALSR